MDTRKDAVIWLAFRSIVGLPLIMVGIAMLQGRDPIGLAAILAGALLIGPSVARLLAEPVSGLFYPSGHLEKKLPLYGIAEAKAAKGDYEAAMQDYENIVVTHPEEIRPHLAMIELAAVQLKDGDRAARVLQKALQLFVKPADQDVLRQVYEANISRLQGKPEWVKEHEEHARSLTVRKADEPYRNEQDLKAVRHDT